MRRSTKIGFGMTIFFAVGIWLLPPAARPFLMFLAVLSGLYSIVVILVPENENAGADNQITVVPDGPPFAPSWSDHDFGNGKTGTRCHAFLLITTSEQAIQPTQARIKFRGLHRLWRTAYEVHLVGPQARVGEVAPARSTSRWSVSFFALPNKKRGTLVADVTITDHLNHRHTAEKVRFAHPGAGNLPR